MCVYICVFELNLCAQRDQVERHTLAIARIPALPKHVAAWASGKKLK